MAPERSMKIIRPTVVMVVIRLRSTVRGAARVGGRRPECRGRDQFSYSNSFVIRLNLWFLPRGAHFPEFSFLLVLHNLIPLGCLVAASHQLPHHLHRDLLILTYDRIARYLYLCSTRYL